LSWPAIRRYHREYRKWKDIGYHGGIDMVGDYPEILIGRPTNVQGAHCPALNRKSLGFCFIGNYNLHPPDERILREAAYRILLPWLIQFEIPIDNVVPHKDHGETDCPGKQFDIDLLKTIIEEVRVKGV
jgi:hypothetical protein